MVTQDSLMNIWERVTAVHFHFQDFILNTHFTGIYVFRYAMALTPYSTAGAGLRLHNTELATITAIIWEFRHLKNAKQIV